MYIKLVRGNKISGGEIETFLEVESIQRYVNKTKDGDLVLVLELDGNPLHYGEDTDVVVYIMNGDGKTIDKFAWNELTRLPELLA